jgi:hypothetical protein
LPATPYAMALWELADDPDDPNEMAKARAAVRSLERRGLVRTYTGRDSRRYIDTTVIAAGFGDGFSVVYEPEASSRVWSGMWVYRG